ncbi:MULTISPECIES: hypothetical protein [unclassified Streptomyces]|uniref:hypothetical protein n=1 Tax=unclassified Streptomyces TaxID=2593676 RepID=UPI00202E1CB8|nr:MULTISPECIES: hypothetical protein [unclassified Streptomyces]MCM1967748.1 hypothetical protein [Streptomyces sp. G1]MCX5129116.1 hypothetical protein [Streptomyces sp. NBC_00347]MCX5299656.1 hypothetical protein [Streptomyces sp. NBC_00193]
MADRKGGPVDQLTAPSGTTPSATTPSSVATPLRRSWLTRRLHIDLLRVCSATAPAS